MENIDTTRAAKTKTLLENIKHDLTHAQKVIPYRSAKSSLEKKLISKLLADSEINLKLNFKEELRKLIFSALNFNDIPRAILQISIFKHYEIAHLIVHEKGQPIATNYSGVIDTSLAATSITAQEFNSLFNLVKKSKNKSFNQGTLEIGYIQSVGNFLAKEFELKGCNLICILSKNSFIPSEQSEIDLFNELAEYLIPLFNFTMEVRKSMIQKDTIIKALELYPDYLAITKSDEVIFHNHADPSSKVSRDISLDEQTSLTITKNTNSEELSTERYHLQRISLLGELLNTLQHELSNPLFGINLASELLTQETEDLENLEMLHEIQAYAKRSQTIIKNFSNLYNFNDEYIDISLEHFLNEVITLTKSETKQIRKKIHWDMENLSPSDLVINTNPTWLSQIIFNLIINAAQALKAQFNDLRSAEINITVRLDNKQLILDVQDNGPGISTDHVERIFEPFYTTKKSGTGLGLSICQNLAKKLGTKIILKTNNSLLGTTFSINLPYK